MNFGYDLFENILNEELEKCLKSHLSEKDDMYILSVEYWPEFTTFVTLRANTYSYLETQTDPSDDEVDYLYYKFCEEEWDGYENMEELDKMLQEHYNRLEEEDADEEICEEHTDKIIDICKAALKKVKDTDVYKEYPELYLNFYIREYFSEDECIETFKELNGETAAIEYAKWLV